MQDAYLNGIRLDTETISDSFQKSLGVYEFPYRDGALIEDMGLSARKVRIRCYFYGADRYPAHKTVLELLRGRKSFELQHPAYGLLSGSVQDVTVRHDDREQTAEIDFEFIEGDTGISAEIYRDVQSGAEDAYESGLEEAREIFEEATRGTLGAEAVSVMDQELDESLGILEQFTGLSRQARAYVKTVDTAVRAVQATLSEVATPANALISTIDFAANLPGRVIGAVAGVAHRYSILYDGMTDAPERFIQSLEDGFTELDNSIFDDTDAGSHLRSAWRCTAALEAGYQCGRLFGEDAQRRLAQKRMGNTTSFDADGNYLNPEAAESVMNVREIENTLYAVRGLIQAAVDEDRRNQGVKDMADLLLAHAREIKQGRERIVAVTIDHEMPLHLVCLKYGLSYQAAERILAINHIPNPNFTKGAINIYAG